jgi:hypothetical protein
VIIASQGLSVEPLRLLVEKICILAQYRAFWHLPHQKPDAFWKPFDSRWYGVLDG